MSYNFPEYRGPGYHSGSGYDTERGLGYVNGCGICYSYSNGYGYGSYGNGLGGYPKTTIIVEPKEA